MRLERNPQFPALKDAGIDLNGLSYFDTNSQLKNLFITGISATDGVRTPLDLRSKLIDGAAKFKWRHAPFSQAFYELDQSTAGFQHLKFEDLTKILKTQQETSRESFEAFGVKFPKETTTRWGVLVILGLQFYLWLHMAEYRKRPYQESDVAWVGVYEGFIARLTFGLTALLLPVAVIVFMGSYRNGLFPTPLVSRIALAFLFVVSACFAAATGREYLKPITAIPDETKPPMVAP